MTHVMDPTQIQQIVQQINVLVGIFVSVKNKKRYSEQFTLKAT